jgi:molecular chaperone GrpE
MVGKTMTKTTNLKIQGEAKPEDPKKEIDEWRNKYLRALADYQNLEKRVTAVRLEETKLAAKIFVLKILPALDALEKAERHVHDQGLTLALKMLKDVLTFEQVERIEVVGKKFDPLVMECVEMKGEEKDDTVTEEVTPGYRMSGQVIRVAKVRVGKTMEKEVNLDLEEKQVKN